VQLELAFKEQLETEERARVAEKERLERERLEARKQREVQRITDVSSSRDLQIHFFSNYYSKSSFIQERKKEGDRWKVNNAGETMNGDDDEFDPNMRYTSQIKYTFFPNCF